MVYVSKSVKETGKIAADLAKQIVSREKGAASWEPRSKAVVIALEGELGAGKTTFVKAFAKSLGIKNKLTSPTFVILRHYKLTTNNYKLLFHIDAYRLNSGEELRTLGIDEIFSDSKNIVLIEWAERVADILPGKIIKVHIDHVGENKRRIDLSL